MAVRMSVLSQALGFQSVIGGAAEHVGMKRSLATAMALKRHGASITVLWRGFFHCFENLKKEKQVTVHLSERKE